MATRRLILVRHGQYARDPEVLTDLGRAQVELTAARLARLRVDRVISSTMPRARETAEILSRAHPDAKREARRGLCERITALPRHGNPPWARDRPDSFWEDADGAVQRAHDKLFRSARSNCLEVYGIHGNMIRSLTLRAMGFPAGAWTELAIHHGGMTVLDVYPKRRIRLLTFNDVGHIPPAMVTEV